MPKNICFVADDDTEPVRIDKYIASVNEELSRTYIQRLIDDRMVLVNDKPVKASYKVEEGDRICYTVPDPQMPSVEPEDIPLDIVYEDDDLIIVNKPKGMVVHPAPGSPGGTLVNALLYRCGDSLSGINGVLRPGIVHRIDKDTTGLIVVCKNDNAHRLIAEQLKVHSVTRRYTALCCGNLKDDEGVVDAPIGRNTTDRKKMAIDRVHGKQAVTHYRVLERFKKGSACYTLIECRLETGRTHQIRVHMSSLGHPLLGDDIYGGARDDYKYLEGQCLHAGVLGLVRPSDGEYIEFNAELPDYFKALLDKMRQ